MTAIAAGPGLGAVGLPTVSVTTPTLPVTTPTLPVTTPTVTLPTPPPPPPSPPPSPPSPPPVSAPSVTVPQVGLPRLTPPPPPADTSASGSPGSAPGSAAAPGGTATASGSAASRSGAWRPGGSSQTASRPLRLNALHRSTMFVFHLAESGRVRVTFREVRCGGTASLTLRGHRGLNRVRFTGRIGRHRLPPGTYRILVRRHGRTLLRKTLVVGDGLANCTIKRALEALVFGGATLFTGTPSSPGAHSDADAARAATSSALTARPHHEGVLGTTVARVLPHSRVARIALLAMLTLGILLLGLAAVPARMVPHPAAAALLARDRVILTAGGLAVMTAVGLAYLMG